MCNGHQCSPLHHWPQLHQWSVTYQWPPKKTDQWCGGLQTRRLLSALQETLGALSRVTPHDERCSVGNLPGPVWVPHNPKSRDPSLGYPCMEYANESRDKRLEQYGMPHNFRQLQPSANETKHLSHAHHWMDFVDELREGKKLLQMFQGNWGWFAVASHAVVVMLT